MGPQGPELERVALAALAESEEPLGAWRLAAILRHAGFAVSEATAGRLLHDFDRRDLTSRASNRGRILNAAGREHLAVLEGQQSVAAKQLLVIDALDWQSRVEVLDFLYVRRGLEAEAARLAAARWTKSDHARLLKTLQEQSTHAMSSSDLWEHGWAFHQAVAVASKSKLIISLFDLFSESHRSLGQISHKIDHVRSEHRVSEHQDILDAIIAGDGEAAARHMVEHLSAVIDDLEAALRSASRVPTTNGARSHQRAG